MPEKYVEEKDEPSESAWVDEDVDMVNHNASSKRGGLMLSNKNDATDPKVTNIQIAQHQVRQTSPTKPELVKKPAAKYAPNRYPTPLRKQASEFVKQKIPTQIHEDSMMDVSIPAETDKGNDTVVAAVDDGEKDKRIRELEEENLMLKDMLRYTILQIQDRQHRDDQRNLARQSYVEQDPYFMFELFKHKAVARSIVQRLENDPFTNE